MKAGLQGADGRAGAFGGTIMHYPRAKVVMTGALDLPLYGRVRQAHHVERRPRRHLERHSRQVASTPRDRGAGGAARPGRSTACGPYARRTVARRAANVVLALGVRGSPAKLGVPGEDLGKVAYRLLEPEEFSGKHVLVVGGGNSAVESALALADFGGCASVAISYRRDKFARCRAENRRRIDEAIGLRKVDFAANSRRARGPRRLGEAREPRGQAVFRERRNHRSDRGHAAVSALEELRYRASDEVRRALIPPGTS